MRIEKRERMVFAGVYAMVVGIGMIGQWGLSLVKKEVPEVETEPIRIGFHLAAEFATAAALLLGGLGLLLEAGWALQIYPVAIGMLVYTAIVSPGYFAQKGELAMVGFFAVVLILAVVSLVLVYGST